MIFVRIFNDACAQNARLVRELSIYDRWVLTICTGPSSDRVVDQI
jgi:hypothetical protein